MKRKLLMLLILALSVLVLSSCADLVGTMNQNSTAAKLDKLQAGYEKAGYSVMRADQAEVSAFAESLASGEGVLLNGALSGLIEYTYVDPVTGDRVLGTVIGTSNKADAKAILDVYLSYAAEEGAIGVQAERDGMIVKVLYVQD